MPRMIDLIRRGGEEPEKEKKPGGKREEGGFRISGAPVGPPPEGKGKAAAPPAPRRSALEGAGEEKASRPVSLSERSAPRRCPYLGGQESRESVLDYPSGANVCYAQRTKEKGLLRTREWPFAAIPVATQRQFCLAAYPRCEFFQRKEAERAPASTPAGAPPSPAP